MALVVLKKTCNIINWIIIFKILEETVIDFKNRRILYKTYKEPKAITNINLIKTTIRIQKGVRQEC